MQLTTRSTALATPQIENQTGTSVSRNQRSLLYRLLRQSRLTQLRGARRERAIWQAIIAMQRTRLAEASIRPLETTTIRDSDLAATSASPTPVRFRVNSRGTRLAWAAVTWVVVASVAAIQPLGGSSARLNSTASTDPATPRSSVAPEIESTSNAKPTADVSAMNSEPPITESESCEWDCSAF